MNMFRTTLLIFFLINCINANIYSQQSDKYIINSPDKTIKLTVSVRNEIFYHVEKDGNMILTPSPISMSLSTGQVIGRNVGLANSTSTSVDEKIETVWGLKKIIQDKYNKLILDFTGYSLEFRAYNEGVAYRWITKLKKEIIIKTEESVYNFQGSPRCWVPDGPTYETAWTKKGFWELDKTKDYPSPFLMLLENGYRVVLTESDLLDYPGMYIRRQSQFKSTVEGSFQNVPIETKWGGVNNYTQIPVTKADYIAKTSGSRSFPWRIMIIAKEDIELAYSDIVYKLASPLVLDNTDWIVPGKVAWEWWNNYILHNVDFKTGTNTPTYIYHIDFAAKYGLEYVLIDWKWTDDRDLTMLNPEVDIHKICKYAKEKDVKVLVWTPSYALDMHLEEVLKLFKSYGVSGIKVDFFDRSDQLAIQMYERIAKTAARYEFVVDFHGAEKPTGLERKYPNILNYESVRGNENNKWSDMGIVHDINIPFIRMINGTMDFTPGGMKNVIKGKWNNASSPVVSGTRSHQAAMFVIYFEALKMLCDAPTLYEAEPEYTKFIAEIPTTWDDTKVLKGIIGEHIVIARKTGETWYIGGMTNWDEKDIVLDLSFLEKGNYKAIICKDGINSNLLATDYKIVSQDITNASKLTIHMASGGGFVIKLSK